MNAGNQLDYILLGPYIDANANINTNMSPESCLSVFSLETIVNPSLPDSYSNSQAPVEIPW